MTNSDSAIWQKSTLPFGDPMQRTYEPHARTNERQPEPTKSSSVPDAPTPVDNPELFTPESMQNHELVAVDAAGMLCACGDSSPSWLEHLGDVALLLLDAPPARAPRVQRRALSEDELWALDQERRQNLASFSRPPRAPKVRRPRTVFTVEQLLAAERALEAMEAA